MSRLPAFACFVTGTDTGVGKTHASAALLHALIPAACEKTASGIIRRLHARIENRGTR